MAIYQRQIQGTIVKPDGTPHEGGTLEIGLSVAVATVPDDTTSEVYAVGGKTVEPISAAGVIDFNLVPNDKITPAGTVWVVIYHLPGNINQKEYWSVLDGVGAIQIGDIIRTNAGTIAGSVAFLIVSTFAGLPAPSASIQGTRGFVQGATDEQDQEYVCMKGWDNVWRWIPAIEGGGP